MAVSRLTRDGTAEPVSRDQILPHYLFVKAYERMYMAEVINGLLEGAK